MGMMGRMEREKRNRERRKYAREKGLKSTEEGGTEWPTATSPAMDGSMVMCAGGREGRNAFLI